MNLRVLLSMLVLAHSGCALLPHGANSASTTRTLDPAQAPLKASAHPWHFPKLSLRLPFFHHKPSPPRAVALQRVGIIRTVSNDGSFVIIELEPGVMIPPGRDLVVLKENHEEIHLCSAENQPPYFIADIKSGQPSPGQLVFQ
jgi:hypothetical protein